ncbi:KRI1 [Acanthosepion pharaonis]|uniref:Protein KRI1 homolog n=1 Tax=Acanthosepion pharaonis TaxID=158019 RepID=A0A812BN93_ACAPH|nr:KRI1 [Sepia pharaonis]
MAATMSCSYDQDSKEKEENSEESESVSSSNSSSEDEEGEALTEQIEKDWLRTLAALKNKDPRIYNKDIKFYQSSDEETEIKSSEKKKKKPVYLQDVQRKTLIETKGAPPPDEKIRYEDDEEVNPRMGPSYYEEQNELKKKFMEAAPSSDEDEDLLMKKGGDMKEEEGAEEEYRMFLKGKKKKLKRDKKLAPELSILKDYWSKPDLDDGEQFLRDYILNKGYKDKNKEKIPSYEDIVKDEESFDEEEKVLYKQEDFERDYNFRFQEPDKNFIKSYPRRIKDSVRPEDNKRAEKRKKVMERKKKEMEKKQEELKKIKKKKKKEIMDKIAELKQITGNSSLGIQDLDLDQEFDSKQHDEMMKKMFNEDYYNEKDTEKPVFSDGNMDGIYDDDFGGQAEHENNDEMPEYNYDDQEVLDIEDPNFNMDADYDPTQYQRKKKGRNRKRKSKKEKPAFFNGDEMTFDEYFDEYYKLDYEDLIEDQPCRYQYRSVVPNDFGLTTEEILKSDDKDLNVWCPLRKLVQYRTDQEEFTDEMIYYKRGKNMDRKKRFLSSFYNKMEKSENGANYEDEHESNSHQNSNQKKGTLKKKQEEENKKKVVVNDSIDMLKESGTKNVAVELSIKKLLCHAVVNEMMQLISCRKNQQSFITTGNCKKAIEQKYDKSANINRNSLENIFPTMII